MSEQAEDQEVEIEESEVDEETLSLAKSMGWVPEDQYRGNKDNWVDAQAFVDKGMNDLPILRERVRAQARQLEEVNQDIEQFKKHHEETAQREYQRAYKDLQERERKTVEEGDTEAWENLQREKATLAQQHNQQQRPAENPILSKWKNDSDWYGKDAEMTQYAESISDYVADKAKREGRQNIFGTVQFLDEVEAEVKARFPNHFENPNRNEPPAVESGGRTRRQSGGKSYADLPPEAKNACDRFVRRGLTTREQYVKDYEWE